MIPFNDDIASLIFPREHQCVSLNVHQQSDHFMLGLEYPHLRKIRLEYEACKAGQLRFDSTLDLRAQSFEEVFNGSHGTSSFSICRERRAADRPRHDALRSPLSHTMVENVGPGGAGRYLHSESCGAFSSSFSIVVAALGISFQSQSPRSLLYTFPQHGQTFSSAGIS